MCGIYFSFINSSHEHSRCYEDGNLCSHRGPDETTTYANDKIFMLFHRLSINGLAHGRQPFEHEDLVYMCNGEIYNYKELARQYNITLTTGSDCEIIGHLYYKIGDMQTVSRLLDGYFCIIIYDKKTNTLYVTRDRYGVISLYYGIQDDKYISFASELKCLSSAESVDHFPPGYLLTISDSSDSSDSCDGNVLTKLYSGVYDTVPRVAATNDILYLTNQIFNLLYTAVQKRLESTEVKFGCFLSGGLDSSIICSLVKLISTNPVHSFAIGFENSIDLRYARVAADYLGTIHHEYIITEDEALHAITETIRAVETYDTTTIRASTMLYLLSKFIKRDFPDIKYMFSGEMADELSGSYSYFVNAQSPEQFQEECLRLLSDLYMYDLLRGNKAVSTNQIELRVPFSDQAFINMYMSIDPKLKMWGCGTPEKQLLRRAFTGYLPDEILNRRKEAFSDGVSCKERSWYTIINEHVDKIMTAVDFTHSDYLIPELGETKYYRSIFEIYFPGREKICKYYWKQRWGNSNDPSAWAQSNVCRD